ncbi:hypothetical protein DID88_001050 [Monilinia fructigena]|uniref:glycerol-3-phosphate dehydrogenase n=1 Tax=Monilinia fructigena TaxID=38457 RepID=A0A395J069_9HELO|nr:hypothetical protein DID88_001050 [Monilinia fructigena]
MAFRQRLAKPLLYTVGATTVGGGILYYTYRPRNIPGADSAVVPPFGADGHFRPPRFPKIKTRAEQIADLKRSGGSQGASSTATPQNEDDVYDLLVIGAGATGAGVALDAATRGLKVAVVERDDFSSGTSSKSTKAYDFLAGSEGIETSYFLTRSKALDAFPMLKKDNLVGALVYYDGAHNDSRMNVSLAMTAALYGSTVVNHLEVTGLEKDANGKLCGATVRDLVEEKDGKTSKEFKIRARGIINATGPFCDSIRKMDDQGVKEIVAPSSGVHVILPGYYSPQKMGLIDPKTSDGRVIFFLPWQGNTIAGTTDSPTKISYNPVASEEEIDWILSEIRRYLAPDINVRRGDVLAAWSGIRPLVKDPNAKNTESLNYGDRAWTVASLSSPTEQRFPVRGEKISPLYPFVDGEVRYAVRHEYAQTAVDVLARRTRLAFLNAQAALEATPRVIDIMAGELGWSSKRKETEWTDTVKFLESMGLPKSKLSATRKQVESGKLEFKDSVEYKMYSRHDQPGDELESDLKFGSKGGLKRGSPAEK